MLRVRFDREVKRLIDLDTGEAFPDPYMVSIERDVSVNEDGTKSVGEWRATLTTPLLGTVPVEVVD